MKSADVIGSAGPQQELVACPHCGSTLRVGRGLCLNCLLYRGLGDETYDSETLASVLDEVDVRDADWRLGNYQILEEIGRGGMGVIYRARQRHSRRIVALKRILSHHSDSRDTLVRFRREAEAAASLDHPNILPIYEVSESEDGLPFFSMKFAAGGSVLENEAAFRGEIGKAVALAAKVARGVEYANSRGILHRDLKPGNVLLDGRGEPLVSDFGLAKWLDASSDLTRTLTIFGTPGYIAPEQASGPASNLKATADVYSLGAILFDLIAGRPPFLGEHALSVIKQAEEKPAPKLRSIVSKVDRDLDTICARCLEREPTGRYQSAGKLAEDLERWLEGRPIAARPVSSVTRTWRWAKRNPKLAMSVAGCVLSGIGILVFATFAFLPGSPKPNQVVSEKSIAVLPFENLSDDKQNSYFTDGVQDEILTNLAKVADLKVISRTSVMQYKTGTRRNLREIARELGVAHVLEGSIQRVGERLRISAQLIDARTDAQIWADHYDRNLTNVFAVESEIAEQIVSQLRANISPLEKSEIETPSTSDLAAHELYIRAKNLMARSVFVRPQESWLEAVRLLDEAVKRDPSFFDALCNLAAAHDVIYILGIDHSSERLASASAAIDRAKQLRPNSGEVHLALADHFYCGYLDYDAAERELALARKSLPNEPRVFELSAYINRRQGRWDESNENFDHALQLDPRNFSILQNLALTYHYLRRYKEQAEVCDRALRIFPKDIGARLARAELELDWHANTAPLRSEIDTILAEEPGASLILADWRILLALNQRDYRLARAAISVLPADGAHNAGFSFPHSWFEAVVARASGDSDAARVAFEAARRDVEKEVTGAGAGAYGEPLSVLALIDAGLGRADEAIREGRRALELLATDAVNRSIATEHLALVYAWLGKRREACEQLTIAATLPGDVSYGQLRLHPNWDSLRGEAAYESVVASLAPK
jgi:serine/threonine protein kinase